MCEFPTSKELTIIIYQHDQDSDSGVSDRIKAVLLSDNGWSNKRIAEALFISKDSVLRHIYDYKTSQKLKSENGGSQAKLSGKNSQKTLPENEVILFLDGVHQTHEVCAVSSCIKREKLLEIATNGRSKRLNILGELNLKKMEVIMQESETINAIKINRFFDDLQAKTPSVSAIHIVLDCAGYQKCAEIAEYILKHNRIFLHHLPPYSPNLNTIERLWKIMHQHTTYNKYYSKFNDFTEAILHFFGKIFPQKEKLLVDTLTDNFRAFQSPIINVA